MNRRGLLVFLFAVLILSVPSVFSGDEKTEEQQAMKTFKQYVSDLMERYRVEKYEQVDATSHCEGHEYVKSSYEPSVASKVDVRKTDSLVSPYAGILEFQWNERYSDCQATREKAQAQSDLKNSNSVNYRYTYAFQDGKWVPTEAEIGSVNPDDVSHLKWESCADDVTHLTRSGFKPDFGCTVPY